MICSLLKRNLQLGFLCRIALGFLDRTVSSVMGCFIGCFRARDDRRLPSSTNLVSNSSRPKQAEAAIYRNDLSSLFLAEEKEDSPSKHSENQCLRSPDTVKGLKDEAMFLKACGTLAETPVEIRKVSSKMKLSPANGRGSDPSKFHSWLPNTSVEKLPQDIKLQQPQIPTNLSEKWGTASDASERTPSSCISSAQNDGRLSTVTTERSGTGSYTANRADANQTGKVDTLLPCRTNSVRFDCETDMSTSGSSSGSFYQSTKKTGTSGDVIDSFEQPQSRRPLSLKTGSKIISSGTELKPEGSLSDWFKPQSAMVENNPNTTNRNLRPPKTPGDRPIIGIVATHWNEEEASRVPPKWWDGNGIPNSTTKYKEDQKVSWHATPFEERLEKALSDETLISRKHTHGKLIAFDENEESDTALSQLQASTHPQSVVSF